MLWCCLSWVHYHCRIVAGAEEEDRERKHQEPRRENSIVKNVSDCRKGK
jgi:hypothetical protein